jgi:hypothetical protein
MEPASIACFPTLVASAAKQCFTEPRRSYGGPHEVHTRLCSDHHHRTALHRRHGHDRASDNRRHHTLGPVDNAWACEDRTAQPIVRKCYGAAYPGKCRIRTRFSIQPRRNSGRRICGPTAAEPRAMAPSFHSTTWRKSASEVTPVRTRKWVDASIGSCHWPAHSANRIFVKNNRHRGSPWRARSEG